jgi:hypothetical protein
MCVVLQEDCEDDVYSPKSLTRFKEHMKSVLQAHLLLH